MRDKKVFLLDGTILEQDEDGQGWHPSSVNWRDVIVTCEECKHSTYDPIMQELWCKGREVEDEWSCPDGERDEE